MSPNLKHLATLKGKTHFEKETLFLRVCVFYICDGNVYALAYMT